MYVSTIKFKSKMNKQKLKEQGVIIFFYKKEIIEQGWNKRAGWKKASRVEKVYNDLIIINL